VEAQRPGSTQSLRPRIGAEERMPEFVEEALRSGQIADGMIDILALMPKATLHYVTHRFGHCGFRDDCDLLSDVVRGLGDDATQRLIETLQTAPASEAAETVGLLTLLAPEAVTKILPVRLSQWPRTSHDSQQPDLRIESITNAETGSPSLAGHCPPGSWTLAAEQSGGSEMLSATRSGDSVGARLHL